MMVSRARVGKGSSGNRTRWEARTVRERIRPDVPEPENSPPVGPSAALRGPFLVAVQGSLDQAVATALPLASRIRARFGALEPVVLVADQRGGDTVLVPPEAAHHDRTSEGRRTLVPAASQGAIPGHTSPLGAALRESLSREAVGLAIVAAEPRDDREEWLELLLAPVVEDGFDFVCPAYRRQRTSGAINTGIVAPLLQTLYGQALRQPLGTEAALAGGLARRLLADADWRRRPAEAGSDAWLVAKALGSDARIAQAWLGTWPRPAGDPEAPSETLTRALDLVFLEMARDAARWQRTGPSRPVRSYGRAGFEPGGGRLDPARLVEAFTLGLSDLRPIWDLVLPPASLLALQRTAARPADAFELPDPLWARVVYDFAVAHMTHAVERGQLLRSLTPLYMGWLSGLARAAARLDDRAFEQRLEAVGAAFEQEKRYLIGRWRWPDDFNP